MGPVVILAEPAVHVLSDRGEDVTPAIRRSYILLLSLGVGVAWLCQPFSDLPPDCSARYILAGFDWRVPCRFSKPFYRPGL